MGQFANVKHNTENCLAACLSETRTIFFQADAQADPFMQMFPHLILMSETWISLIMLKWLVNITDLDPAPMAFTG